jgi:hypothetical protein
MQHVFKFKLWDAVRDTRTGFIGSISVLTLSDLGPGAWVARVNDKGSIEENWFHEDRLTRA